MHGLILATVICSRLASGALECDRPLPEDSLCVEVKGVPDMVVCEPPQPRGRVFYAGVTH